MGVRSPGIGGEGAPGKAPTLSIGNVTTLPAGSTATANVRLVSEGAYVVDLGLPAGVAGTPGTPGAPGTNGTNGTNGTPGANGSTPTLSIGSVTTLAAGSAATANVRLISGTSYAVDLGIPAGATGQTGPAGPTTAAPSTSTRVKGTTFQPHATKPVLVSYTVKTQVTNPLLAGASVATMQLLSDAASPPTTERARVEAGSSVGLTVSLALTTWNTATLSYIVPAGHYVRLVETVSGTGSTAIVSQVEEALG